MANPEISNLETNRSSQNVSNTQQTRAAADESATDRRRRISRENGSKSKGPITPEGKAISSRNACKFGLRAENVHAETRNCESYRNIYNGFVAEFQPVSPVEVSAIGRMTAYTFQLQVIWELRAALSNDSIDDARNELNKIRQRNPVITLNAIDKALSDSDSALKQFASNEVRYDQMYRRALKEVQLYIQTRSLLCGAPNEPGSDAANQPSISAPNEPSIPAATNSSHISAPNEPGSTSPSLVCTPDKPTAPAPPITSSLPPAPNEPSIRAATNSSHISAPNEPSSTYPSLTCTPNKPTGEPPISAPNEPSLAAATNQSPISATNEPSSAEASLTCAPNEPTASRPPISPAPNEPCSANPSRPSRPNKPTAADPNLDLLQSILATLDQFPEAKRQILNAIDALQQPSPIAKSAGN